MTESKEKLNNIYPKTSTNPDISKIENGIIEFWQNDNIFEQSVDNLPKQSEGGNEFSFFDGPPFANGLPHYGHLLTSAVKDIYARYHTMKGERAERVFGWDCHGLPAEMEAEKELGIQGQLAIQEFGIGKFNDTCRTSVMKYTDEWQDYVNRAGRWVDFENGYKTMDKNYMESVIWAFAELHKKGLVYEGHKVMPYSWAAETPLSNFETRMDNAYREKVSKAITVAFELEEVPEAKISKADKYYIVAWTTTPWTLPSNLALAVSFDIDYSEILIKFKSGKKICFIGSRNYLSFNQEDYLKLLFTEEFKNDEVLGSNFGQKNFKGKDLLGLRYKPLFPYFAGDERGGENAFTIIEGDFVSDEDGTGIVHLAPGFGEDDQRVCQENGICLPQNGGIICPVDEKGQYTKEIFDIALESENFYFRKYTKSEEDIKSFRELFTDPKVAPFFQNTDTKNIEKVIDKLNNHHEDEGFSEYGIFEKVTGDFVGHAGFAVFDLDSDYAEFCYAIHKEFRGEGHAREILDAILGWGSENIKLKLLALVEPDNQISKSLIEDFGAKPFKQGKDQIGKIVNYYEINKDKNSYNFELPTPTFSLKGLNVMKSKEKSEDEPYKDDQMEKYGLVNLRITTYLKQKGQLIKQDDYTHNYPHCWRTDTPLIYKAVPSWYVEVTKFKDRMVELNKKINWIPDHIRDGQFGKWLANAHDWAISRNRFWGAPIPVWKTPSGKMKVFGSIAEMEEFFGVKVPDLHRPFIDELTAKDEETGETYTRVPEVLDCWFESGSMPFAELHYPFENKEKFECRFPADFIVEYVAQTRGWFYTLMVLSTALFDEIPFKNCICHGVILGEPIKNPETGKMEKQKLSKRLRNYPDPLEAFEQYGADAIRWMMVSSPIMNGGELSIAKDGSDMHEVIRLVIKPIWNAYHFFTLYANSDGIKAEERFDSENLMDRYILSKLKVAVDKTDKSLENYNTAEATQAIEEFFEVLNNWYIRRSRERFWRSMDDKKNIEDKKAAYDTLYTCLINILKVAAPIIPFISEYIFKNLTGEKSVHLQSFPNIDIEEDSQLINNMDKVRDVCNVGLSIRNAENVRIRQPLANIHIFGDESVKSLESYKDIISDELNVKNIEISTDLANKADLTLKINFPVLGKRLPAKMKQIIPASKKGEWKQLDNGNIEIAGEELFGEEFEVKLQSKDDKTAQPLSTNDALVALDLNITDELAKEGIARDIVRLIQQARKDADLNISDHIDLVLSNLPDQAKDAVKDNHSYIAEQTLSANISVNSGLSQQFKKSYPLGDSEIEVGFDVTKRDVA